MRLTRILRVLIVFAIAWAVVGSTGCGRKAKAAVPAPKVTGLWETQSSKGKAASLSEIGFDGDGTFKHVGLNALGKPVTFQGLYRVGESEQGPVVELIYDDFPDRPTQWYFRLDGDVMWVSEMPQDLGTENALRFERVQQQ